MAVALTAASRCLIVIYYHPCYPSLPFYYHSTINQGGKKGASTPIHACFRREIWSGVMSRAPQAEVEIMSETYRLQVSRNFSFLPSGQILYFALQHRPCWITPLLSCLHNFCATAWSVMPNRLTWLLTALMSGFDFSTVGNGFNYECLLAAFSTRLRSLQNTGRAYIYVYMWCGMMFRPQHHKPAYPRSACVAPVWHDDTLHLIY